jgi:hypothetical protein
MLSWKQQIVKLCIVQTYFNYEINAIMLLWHSSKHQYEMA